MVDGGGAGSVSDDMICTVAETGSTNADLLALAAAGAAEGSWLRAERQTAGKGRQGRAWESPVGNFYGSTLVRLRPTDPPAPTLALVTAVALQEAVDIGLGIGRSIKRNDDDGSGRAVGRIVSRFGPLGPGDPYIKWPNDLLIDGAKLSGALLERADHAVVVGIGVNLAGHPNLANRQTTSLHAHGAELEPAIFAEILAGAFGQWLSIWREEGLGPVLRRWLARAHPVGTPLTAHLPDGTAHDGLFDGLTTDGALILRLADGARHVIHAGDVFLI